MATRDIVVVVGSSAGGLAALKVLASALPADLPASIFVVSHLSADFPSVLPEILQRLTSMRVATARDEEPIEPGRIYVAPPDFHLLVERERVRVVRGPKENRHRPAIDPLFRSAAWSFGPRVVGVVLSGNLDDGTAGLWAIKSCGGTTVVQDPADALYPEMPRNAAMHNQVDHILPIAQIGPLLVELSHQPAPSPNGFERPATVETEVQFARLNRDITDIGPLGAVSPFTCPACRGALWELEDGDNLRYRCHAGHAYGQETLAAEQTVAIESALYVSLRAVEEKATALRRMSQRAQDRSEQLASQYRDRANELDATAELIRGLLAGEVER